ncbi:recombination-associated protein RdgC [Methylotenera sp.]|uniref:recombination-associated protein RdgC n=1 Tax=Methylotenera sp. TaxID=2051956 RepID=UPI0025EFDFB3|nr:recombination-associated protein RdgC [Methylotenera sp.]
MIKNTISLLIANTFDAKLPQLEELLSGEAFTPCLPEQQVKFGWGQVASEQFVKKVGSHFLMRFVSEKKSVPSGALKAAMADAAKLHEEENGVAMTKGELKRLKENLMAVMLPRAFPKRTEMFVWIDTKNNTVNFDTSGNPKMEEALSFLQKTLKGELEVTRISTDTSPAMAMTGWLLGETPTDLAVDDQCELVSPSENKPTIKYVRHDLSGQDVLDHIKQGKVPANLAMTFKDCLSFVLTDKMIIKGIAPLDFVNKEMEEVDQEDKELIFDTSFMLMADQIGNLTNCLISNMAGDTA